MQYQGMQFWAARRSDCSHSHPVVWGFHSGFCLQRLPSHCIITAFWRGHGPWIVFGERHVPLPNTIFPSSCAPASPFHISPGSSASQPVYPQLSCLFFPLSCHLCCPLFYPQGSSHTAVLQRPRGRCPWTLKRDVCGRLFSGFYANAGITTRRSSTH